MQMEFVLVDRVEHGDRMVIPAFVQAQYPNKFKIVVEETKVEEEEAPKKNTRKRGQ